MYLKQILEARALASPVGWGINAVNTSPAFVVQYVPSLGTDGAAATIALIQDGAMTFLVDGVAPAGADAIGTAGVITTSAASYDTIGELVDYINSTQAWRAYIAAALRADGCETLQEKSAATCFTDNGLTFYWDTSAGIQHSAVISGEKFVNQGVGGYREDADGQCENYLISGTQTYTFNTTGAGVLTIHSCSQRSDGTTLFTVALANATAKPLDGTLDAPFMRSTTGQRLVIRAADDAADDIEAVAQVIAGRTAVLRNTHQVVGVNY
jgi:hypothetical protein